MSEIKTEIDLDVEFVRGVLNEIFIFLEQQTMLGIHKTSVFNVEQLSSLIINAHVAKLVAIERQLQGLREILNKYLNKEDLPLNEYLLRITRIWNYAQAAKCIIEGKSHPLDRWEAIGVQRSQYKTVPNFDAIPMTAFGWISDSGYVGATVLFAVENSEKPDNVDPSGLESGLESLNIISVVNVRPQQYMFHPDPLVLFQTTGYTGYSLQDMAKGAIGFRNVKMNYKRQISLSRDLVVVPLDRQTYEMPNNFPIVEEWATAIQILRTIDLKPMEGFSQTNLVLLKPHSYGRPNFDPVNALWSADLLDSTQHRIRIILRDTPTNQRTVANLDTLFEKNSLPHAIFGKLFIFGGKIAF